MTNPLLSQWKLLMWTKKSTNHYFPFDFLTNNEKNECLDYFVLILTCKLDNYTAYRDNRIEKSWTSSLTEVPVSLLLVLHLFQFFIFIPYVVRRCCTTARRTTFLSTVFILLWVSRWGRWLIYQDCFPNKAGAKMRLIRLFGACTLSKRSIQTSFFKKLPEPVRAFDFTLLVVLNQQLKKVLKNYLGVLSAVFTQGIANSCYICSNLTKTTLLVLLAVSELASFT